VLDFAPMNWHTIGQGALSGFASAALVDFAAFRSWKSVQEAREYSWGLAAWRWFQGAVIGAVMATGFGAVTG